MTTVKVERNGHWYDVDIAGHSGFGARGSDIVCAACSVLTCTLEAAILEKEALGAVAEFITLAEEPGRRAFRFRSSEWAWSEVETIVKTILTGFQMLHAEYPRHVRLLEGVG